MSSTGKRRISTNALRCLKRIPSQMESDNFSGHSGLHQRLNGCVFSEQTFFGFHFWLQEPFERGDDKTITGLSPSAESAKLLQQAATPWAHKNVTVGVHRDPV